MNPTSRYLWQSQPFSRDNNDTITSVALGGGSPDNVGVDRAIQFVPPRVNHT